MGVMALPPKLSEKSVESRYLKLAQQPLEAVIKIADQRYWDGKDSGISDQLFDRLVHRLLNIAPTSKVLNGIGFMRHQKTWGESVKHSRPMLSLQKAYTVDEIISWANSLEAPVFTVMPKVDGVALSLRYDEKGIFRRAITRGSGRKGEDVTFAVGRLACIPDHLPAAKCPAEIRGELYFPKKSFKKFSDRFSAARNAAVGYLKNQSGTEVLPLEFFPYAAKLAHTPISHCELVWELCNLFKTKMFRTAAKLDGGGLAGLLRIKPEAYECWPFEADGLVIRIDRNDLYEEAGATAHHPRGAIAFKFSDTSAETVLEDVVWETSRSGVITPVAIFAPIEVGGATLSRATLHNVSRVEELELTIGCKLEVTRRGGVIPQVERAFDHAKGSRVRIPEKCPECKFTAEWRSSVKCNVLCCLNTKCPAVLIGSIIHFTSTIGIKGFGPEITRQLVEEELLEDIFSVYDSELTPLWEEIIGEKITKNLVDQIEAHKSIPLDTFLTALGIEALGAQTARAVAEKFLTLGDVLSSKADFTQVSGIGCLSAGLIRSGLEIMRPEICVWLAFYGPDIQSFAPKKKRKRGWFGSPLEKHVLEGKSVLFTGTLSIPRAQAEAAVEKCGGTVTMFPTQSLSVLVTSGQDSKKFRTVRELNAKGSYITIWSEKEFRLNVPNAYKDESND